MNYDIDTPEGMANSVDWTTNRLKHLHDGGSWLIPRSSTGVTVRSHAAKTCRIYDYGPIPDTAIGRVLLAAGWTILSEADDIAETREKMADEYAAGFDSAP